MKNRKYIIFGVIALLIVALIVGIVWYRAPIDVERSLTVCNYDGDTVEVELDLQYHRRFFRYNRISGTITWDGAVYKEASEEVYTKAVRDPLRFWEPIVDGIKIFLNKSKEQAPRSTNTFIPIEYNYLDHFLTYLLIHFLFYFQYF